MFYNVADVDRGVRINAIDTTVKTNYFCIIDNKFPPEDKIRQTYSGSESCHCHGLLSVVICNFDVEESYAVKWTECQITDTDIRREKFR